MVTASGFTAYGASHRVVLLVLLVGAMLLVTAGRARRDARAGTRIGRALAVAILALTVPVQLLFLTPEYWSLERTLPLQLCDLAWMAAAFALWTRRRWAVSLTYYWGLSLTMQAILTPDLAADFPDPAFLAFWALHLLIVWAAVYLTWGLGLTPDWRSYRTTLLVTVGWAVTMLGLNAAAGTNFGYLNAKPPTASLLDLLGPWPWYVLVGAAVVAVVWAVMTWPWVALGRARTARAAQSRSPRRGAPTG